jgi:hypothetical protein
MLDAQVLNIESLQREADCGKIILSLCARLRQALRSGRSLGTLDLHASPVRQI